jgi:hypothetical protein
MADDPQDDQGAKETASPAPDDTTAEIPAVTSDASTPEPDEEMLAAFLGTARVAEPMELALDLDPAPMPETAGVPEPETTTGPVADAPVAPAVEAADEPSAQAAAAGTPDGPVSHAAPGRSAWSTALVVVGVILIAGAVGAAGVVAGRLTAPDPGVVIQTEAVVEEDIAAPRMPVGPLPVPAPGTVIVTTARVPSATWPVMVTDAANLPDDAGTAPGYRLVNSGISGAQVASILASTFGVAASATQTETGWEAGAPGEPRVAVIDDPLFSWVYEDPAALALAAATPAIEPRDALPLATDVLAGIGVDISTLEFEVGEQDGRTVVNAWQVVGEQRTQLGWRLVFDADGTVLAASGFSSGFEAVPDYPIVGAASAVARSQQSPWTAIPASPITGPTDGTTVAPTPAPSASGVPVVGLPMSAVEVVSAELGLAQYWQPDGGILLLPSWILTGSDGSTWSLLAVAEPAITFVTQPFPLSGDEQGFVAAPFPSPSADEGTDAGLAEEPLPGEAGVPIDGSVPDEGVPDAGMLEENGDSVFDPSADPAATP